jgi:peroxiredoxin
MKLSPRRAARVLILCTVLAPAFLLPARAGADGPAGRPVVGCISAPADGGVTVDWAEGESSIRSYQPAIRPPEGLSAQEKVQWYREWSRSEAAQVYLGRQRAYPVKIGPDGSFRVDDMPAGHYVLSVRISEPKDPRQSSLAGQVLGSVTHSFTVSESPADRGVEPLDLGKLELKVAKRLRVGDPAPPFQIESLDRKGSVKLEDYRGKYVLLTFWATWCRPCHGQTPYLKRVAEAFAKDNRFAIVGVSWDHSREEAQQYVAKNDLSWTQGFLGDTTVNAAGSKVVEDYSLGLPSIWLIGPDGRIVARDLLGEAIEAFVAKSLGKPR